MFPRRLSPVWRVTGEERVEVAVEPTGRHVRNDENHEDCIHADGGRESADTVDGGPFDESIGGDQGDENAGYEGGIEGFDSCGGRRRSILLSSRSRASSSLWLITPNSQSSVLAVSGFQFGLLFLVPIEAI